MYFLSGEGTENLIENNSSAHSSPFPCEHETEKKKKFPTTPQKFEIFFRCEKKAGREKFKENMESWYQKN